MLKANLEVIGSGLARCRILLYGLIILGNVWPGCWTTHGQELQSVSTKIHDQPIPITTVETSAKLEVKEADYVCQLTAVEVDSSVFTESKLEWSKLVPELSGPPKSVKDIASVISPDDQLVHLGGVNYGQRLIEILAAMNEQGAARYICKDVYIPSNEGRMGEFATGKDVLVKSIRAECKADLQSHFHGITFKFSATKPRDDSIVMEVSGLFSGLSKFSNEDGSSIQQVSRLSTGYCLKPNQLSALILPINSTAAPKATEREIVFFFSIRKIAH